MTLEFANRVRVTCSTVGTGNLVLGAALTPFFGTDRLTNGATYDYEITDGVNSEVGTGLWTTSSLTLARGCEQSTQSDAPLTLSGNAVVIVTILADTLQAMLNASALLLQDASTPFYGVGQGQSNEVGNGPSNDTPGTGQLAVNQTGGGIWIYDDQQNLMVPAAYGTYPLTNQQRGKYCPNPLISFANSLRACGRMPLAKPIHLMLVTRGGTSISNWIGLKQNTASVPATQGQFLLNKFKLWIGSTRANWPRVDFQQWIQGEEDSTTTTADTINGDGTFADNGFGNNASGTFENDAFFTSTVSGAIVTAGGFNRQAGYGVAFGALVAAWRAMPQFSPSTPIICAELHDYWHTTENTRNDFFTSISTGADPFLGVVPTAGLTGDTVPGNTNHWDAASQVALGPRFLNKYLQMMVGGSGGGVNDLYGNKVASKYQLTLVGNVDQLGVTNSSDGLSYTVAVDQLRNGAAIKSTASTILLPNADHIVGIVEMDLNVASISGGPTNLLSTQPINGISFQPTFVTFNNFTYYQYTFFVTGWWKFNSAATRWNLISNGQLPTIQRGTDIGITNIGINPYTMYLSGPMVTGNTIATTYTLDGHTNTISTPFDTNLDLTLIDHAASLQTSFNAIVPGWLCTEILGQNAIGISGPAGHALTSVTNVVTGGASQATSTWLPNVYALANFQVNNFAYGCVAGVRYVLPSSNGTYPALVELIANGGGGTAGDIYVDCWSDSLNDRFGINNVGTSGNTNLLTIPFGQTGVFQPTANSRWHALGGTYLTTPYLRQVATALGANNPAQVSLSGALVTGNTLTINGTADATPFTAVVQVFSQNSGISLAQSAVALQASLNAVIAGYVCYAIPAQNIIQVLPPAGHTVTFNAGTSAVTGGASQATLTFPANTLNLTPDQCHGYGYLLTAGVTYNLPSPNTGQGQYRFGLQAPASGTMPILGFVSGGMIDRNGNPNLTTLTLRINQTIVFENASTNRWWATGGSYLGATGTTTVANLQAAASAKVGARDFVTDALSPVFGSTVSAGGAIGVPVYSDGSVWKVG